MIKVSRETPRQDDVVTLIRQSDALMQSLYPAESNHLVDIDQLAAPQVHSSSRARTAARSAAAPSC